MSRIGKLPIKIAEAVKVTLKDNVLNVSGPKGELSLSFNPKVSIKINETEIICSAEKKDNSLWGLTRSLINNSVLGVSLGWSKTLELVGVGYRAVIEGEDLVLSVGFSHPVRFQGLKDIKYSVTENKIKIEGIDKQLVGELAAEIRKVKPPEPYKGKGIRYSGEKIRKKLGKAAKTIGGAAGQAGGKA